MVVCSKIALMVSLVQLFIKGAYSCTYLTSVVREDSKKHYFASDLFQVLANALPRREKLCL
jgi:hypothetical protein